MRNFLVDIGVFLTHDGLINRPFSRHFGKEAVDLRSPKQKAPSKYRPVAKESPIISKRSAQTINPELSCGGSTYIYLGQLAKSLTKRKTFPPNIAPYVLPGRHPLLVPQFRPLVILLNIAHMEFKPVDLPALSRPFS